MNIVKSEDRRLAEWRQYEEWQREVERLSAKTNWTSADRCRFGWYNYLLEEKPDGDPPGRFGLADRLGKAVADVERLAVSAAGPASMPRLSPLGSIAGCARRWWSFSFDGRQTAPFAFSEALASGENVLACINHDRSKVVGQTCDGSLSIWEDSEGLKFQLTPYDTELGRQALYMASPIDPCGISTYTIGTEVDNRPPGLVRPIAELVEISLTRRPKFSGTSARTIWAPR